MGYDAYAVCLVGIRVDQNNLQKVLYYEEQQRSCRCLEETPKSRCCPECGKPVWKNVKVPIKDYDYENETLFGFKLCCRSSEDRHPEYISVIRTRLVGPRCSDTLYPDEMDFSVLMESMKAKLEPLGLWDAKAFGVHVFLYESC